MIQAADREAIVPGPGGGVGAGAEHLQLQAAEAHRLEGLGKVSGLFPH